MAHYQRRQRNYVQKEFEGEESEEIEEMEVNGYNSNELYPTSINFIIPSKQRLQSKINKTKCNHNFNKKKIKSRELPIPICTCKLPNSNYQNNNNIQYRIPTYTNICPYCIHENESNNENQSFRTEISNFPFNEIQEDNNGYINYNRSKRNIRGNIENKKYMINSLPRLNRREIPYNNELVYIIPYPKNEMPEGSFQIDSNIMKKNKDFIFDDNHIFLKDKGIVKIIRDNNEIINLNDIDMNYKGEKKYNDIFIVEQKTNNFIIDNEVFPSEKMNLKEKNENLMKDNYNKIEKNSCNKPKFNDDKNEQNFDEDENNKREEDLLKNLNINNLNKDKEKNLNLTEENENYDYEKNIDTNDKNSIIKNNSSEEKINNLEEKQKELLEHDKMEQKEENNIDNENVEENEKNLFSLNEKCIDLNNELNEQKEENINLNEKENFNQNEENINLNEKENFEQNENEEKQLDIINLEQNSNGINKDDIKTENNIIENELKDLAQIQELNTEENINEKIDNLIDNNLEKNNDNDKDNNLIINHNIQEDDREIKEEEEINLKKNEEDINLKEKEEDINLKEKEEDINLKEKEENINLKEKEYNQINNYNIEPVDENEEYEQNIKNDENAEDEYINQININKEENDIIINKNEQEKTDNYESTNNPKIESGYNNINNKEEKKTNISIKQNLQNEFNININTNEKNNENNYKDFNKKNSLNPLNNNLNLDNKISNYKVPQSSQLLFKPKIKKTKKIEPLFNKYEQLEGHEQQYSSSSFYATEPSYKKEIEIFPSHFEIGMSYINPFKQTYIINNANNLSNKKAAKKYHNKTTSDKNRNLLKEMNQNNKYKNEIDIRNSNKKNYQTYINSSKIHNPFVSFSDYDKNIKERKKLISKKIQKEENLLNDILIIEKNIIKKRNLTEKESNLIIVKLSNYLFEIKEKKLDNNVSSDYKINKITNIIKIMPKEEQSKILENLKKHSKNEYSNEVISKLKNKIENFKDKSLKAYKTEKN